jgi:hypothetical protein
MLLNHGIRKSTRCDPITEGRIVVWCSNTETSHTDQTVSRARRWSNSSQDNLRLLVVI